MMPKQNDVKNSKIKVKPIRATVVEDPADWKKMWNVALTPPSEAQLSRMKHLRQCFSQQQ
ncbi:MAG: hypothetical protein LBN21_01120 [Treponema sp.]|jgi:hypothetical protein|nr:hypothetical protein [Treponema sp.]